MIRELAQIIFAIHMSLSPFRPVSDAKVKQFATEIQKSAETTQVDPLIYVAIITHESGWDERAISQDGEDYGLMQVRGRHYNGGKHPEWLLNPHVNLMAGSYVIQKSTDFCRRYLKREPTLQEWMSVYQGSLPSCKRSKLTKIVEDYYMCLVQNVEKDPEDGPAMDCQAIYQRGI
jgi:hypothetical protein